ncbi:MAG: hypothetical protein LBC97_00525 [Bifidobacteriaceae bacterium]|nr:hypothetical protein [Bifidobacteriaceae bacterium]
MGAGEHRGRAGSHTAAAGDAIPAGISAKDAIVTELVGQTFETRNHAAAARELRSALGTRPDAARTEQAPKEVLAAKTYVEHGSALASTHQATALVRRPQTLVKAAAEIVRLRR